MSRLLDILSFSPDDPQDPANTSRSSIWPFMGTLRCGDAHSPMEPAASTRPSLMDGSVALGFFSPNWVFVFTKAEQIFSAFSVVIDEWFTVSNWA